MRKWDYTLKSGPALRRAIFNADYTYASYLAVLRALRAALDEIGMIFPEYLETECTEEIEEINYLIALLEKAVAGDEEAIATIEHELPYYIEDLIDDHLEWFYDECDSENIWVGL